MQHLDFKPILTAEEESDLGRRAHGGDEDAIQELVRRNIGLAYKIAHRYRPATQTREDIEQEAMCGLCIAARRFDPDSHPGIRFSTYATWWMKATVNRALTERGHLIHIPAYIHKAQNCDQSTISRKKRECVSKARRAMKKQGWAEVNELDNMPGKDPLPDSEVEARDSIKVIEKLTHREQCIIALRYGLNGYGEFSYAEIGRKLGLGRAWVTRIERAAMTRLRRWLET